MKHRDIEARVGPLDQYLVRRLNEEATYKEIAQELGVSIATIGYWLLKYKVQVRHEVMVGESWNSY